MDCRLFMVQRTHNGEAIRHLGHQREMLANIDSGNGCAYGPEWAADVAGSIRLQIPGVELTGAAHKD